MNSRGFTRREWLAMLGAAGAAACAPATAPSAVSSGAPSTSAAPKRGGILRIGKRGEAPQAGGLDIYQQTLSSARDMGAPAYETLLNFDATKTELSYANFVPQLAKSWTVSPDGKTYTFEIFPGVKWHDGTPLTADDVKFSFDRIRTPPAGTTSARKSLFSAIGDVSVKGDTTVVIGLSTISQNMLATIADVFTAIVPRHVVQKEGSLKNVVVGSGPFKLKTFRPGQGGDFERNTDYHFSGLPYLDGITLTWIPEFSTLLDAFYTGRIDITDTGVPLSEDEADIIRRDKPQTILVPLQTLKYRYVAMSTKFKPFDDVRVRQAINEAIDRKELMDQQGDKGVLCKGYFPPAMPEYLLSDSELAALPGFGTNMDARRAHAKALLAEAGYPNGFEMTVVGRPDLPFSRDMAQIVPQHLAKVGIKATTKLMDSATYSPLEANSDIPFRVKNDSLRGIDPDDVMVLNFLTKAGRNSEAYTDSKVDVLLKEQSITLDAAKRQNLVKEVQKAVLTSSHRIPLWWPNSYVAISPQVKGFVPQSLEDTATLRYEKVWLDK